MDNNTTVAINILVQTSMGAAASDFQKHLGRMEADARAWVNRLNKIFAGVRAPSFGAAMPSGSGRSGSAIDPNLKSAQADIARMIADRKRWADDVTRAEARAARTQAADRVREYKRSMNQIEAEFARTQAVMTSKGGGLGVFAGTMFGNLAAQAIQQGIGLVKQAASTWLDYASTLEQARIGMATMTGSITVANAHLEELQNFAKTTPFEFQELVVASQKLQGVGFAAEKVLPILKDVGNALSASGRINELPFAIKALGDIQAKGKLAGQEIIQLANAGIPAIKMLQNELKLSSAEVLKLSENGQISADTLFRALHRMSEERFGDAMVQQSKTFRGAMSNITDTLKQTSEVAFRPLYQRISRLAVDFATEVGRQNNDFMKVGEVMAKYIGEGLGAGLETVMGGIGAYIGRRFEQIFTGEAIVDPISRGIFLGITRGITRGLKSLDDRLPWWMRNPLLQTGTAKDFMNPPGAPAPGSYTKTMPGTSGFRMNLTPPNTQSSIFGRNLFGTPFGAPNTGNVRVTMLDPADPDGKKKTGGGGGSGGAAPKRVSPHAQTIINAARAIGVSPLDYATFLFYEGAGSLSTSRWGGAGGNYLGPMQMGRWEQKKYGITPGMPLDKYLAGANKYLIDRGVKPGMGLAELYTAINYGNVHSGVKLNAKDQNGTIAQHLRNMTTGSARSKARSLLDGADIGGSDTLVDVASQLAQFSDAATKAAQDANTRAAIEMWKRSGLIPTGDMLNRFHALAVEEARASGAIQPNEADIAYDFQVAAAQRQGRRAFGSRAIEQTGTVSSALIGRRKSEEELYVEGLRESLRLEERYYAVVLQENTANEVASALIEEQFLVRKEAYAQNVIDYKVTAARNVELEAALAFEQSRTAELGKRKDIQGALRTLEMQNADAAFVAQRRQNRADEERFDLNKRITDLQDYLANGGVNDSLKVQASALEDIVRLRERELQAVMDINTAQTEIAQQTVYSATQANAAVLQYMANQKGVTQSMADFKIGLLESGYDLIDRGLDAILPKMGRLTSVVKDLLSSFIRLALNAGFRKLFGLDAVAGGAGVRQTSGGGIGGGITGILGGLFGGGSSSTGGGSVGQIFGGASPGGGGLIYNLGGGLRGIGGGNPFGMSYGDIVAQRNGGLTVGGAPGVVGAGGGSGTGGVGGVIGQVAGVAGKGKGFLGQLFGSSIFAGGLAGGFAGAGLGRGSVGGTILGGVGGALLGGAAGVAALGGSGAAIFGATGALSALAPAAAFLTNPFTIAIGAGILLAAFFLGRKAREKKEKRQVEQLSGDAVSKIKQLIEDVKAFKLSGSEAYNAGVQIRDQFAEQISQLKSGGAKRLAQSKLADINGMLQTLKTEGDRSDRLKNIAKVTDEKLVPTFATGGFTGFGAGAQLMVAHGHEAVLTQSNIMALGGYKALQQAGVKGINMSGAPDRTSRSSRFSSGNDTPVFVATFFDEAAADEWMAKVSPLGVAKKVRAAANGEMGGMVEMFARKLSGK